MSDFTLDQAFVARFSSNIYVLVREGGSKLRGLLPAETGRGETHFFERMGALTMTDVIDRNVPPPIQNSDHSRRMATIRQKQGRTLKAKIDQFKMLIDPTSEEVRAFADAAGKAYDITGYEAMVGPAASGKDGSGSTPFDPDQIIPANDEFLTVSKINNALYILERNEINLDATPLFMAANADGVHDMMNDPTNRLLSFDFQDKKVLSGTGVVNFRGINIYRTQYVPQPTDERRVLIFTRDNTKMVIAQEFEVRIDERVDLNHEKQIATYITIGAVRMDEKTVTDVRSKLPVGFARRSEEPMVMAEAPAASVRCPKNPKSPKET